jgi:ATP-dependent DNA helicase DinG
MGQHAIDLLRLAAFPRRNTQDMLTEHLAAVMKAGCESESMTVSGAEAPTGTGKTFAALAAALAAFLSKGERTVIATHSHVLQNQILYKDIPSLRKRLLDKVPEIFKWKAAEVRGRRGHLCLRRATLFSRDMHGGCIVRDEEGVHIPVDRALLGELTAAAGGEIPPPFPEEHPLFRLLAGNTHTCVGKTCPKRGRCPYIRALLRKAPLIVTNHALLFALIEEESKGEVLEPSEGIPLLQADHLVIDEAHHLMGYTTRTALRGAVALAEFAAFRTVPIPLSIPSNALSEIMSIRDAFAEWGQSYLETLAETGHPRHFRKGSELVTRMLTLTPDQQHFLREDALRAKTLLRRCHELGKQVLQGERQVITDGESFSIKGGEARDLRTDLVRAFVALKSVFVMTGTLGKPGIFQAETGLPFSPPPLLLPDPYANIRSVTVWVPKRFPSPSSRTRPSYEELLKAFVVRYVPPYVREDHGGVLILSTSLKRMHSIAEALAEPLHAAGRRLLVQGTLPRGDLVRTFLKSSSPVLVGSASFREGFDAPGKKLTWVILDRIPFVSPDNPDADRRAKALIRSKTVTSKFEHGLGLAAMYLRQAVGRLIRSESDWGTITILDSRLHTKPAWGLAACLPVPRERWITDYPEEHPHPNRY